MKTLKDICVSLEVAKKLKKAGFDDSIFVWVKFKFWDEPQIVMRDKFPMELVCLSGEKEYSYPAYVISELCLLLKKIKDKEAIDFLEVDTFAMLLLRKLKS
jgi:hypothetical protein